MNGNVVMILSMFTLGAVLIIAIVSWLRAKKAKDHHEDAAAAHGTHNASALDHDPAQDADDGRTWSEERGANPPTPEHPIPMPPRN